MSRKSLTLSFCKLTIFSENILFYFNSICMSVVVMITHNCDFGLENLLCCMTSTSSYNKWPSNYNSFTLEHFYRKYLYTLFHRVKEKVYWLVQKKLEKDNFLTESTCLTKVLLWSDSAYLDYDAFLVNKVKTWKSQAVRFQKQRKKYQIIRRKKWGQNVQGPKKYSSTWS